MARIRSLHPSFWTDGNMVRLTPYARLLYMGTWNFCCDGGHLPDDPLALKLQILPADPVDPDELVDELVKLGRLIRRQLPDGRRYLFNPRLTDHQKIDPRWRTRCPYCTWETESGGDARPTPGPPSLFDPPPDEDPPEDREDREPPANSGESRGVSANTPTHTETLPSSSSDWSGEVKTLPDANPSGATSDPSSSPRSPRDGPKTAAPKSDRPPTQNQRAKPITDAYAAAEPMCNWPGVNRIVIKAIKAGKWTDDAIRQALLRLADQGRTVTTDSLRIELDGPPRSRKRPPGHLDV